ncbi:hypothetical protein FACS189418_2060 [Clostridia bacterium]|nr:hypothetical protein FACS189418_2060 [Clostridia bacterium]
MKIMHKKVLLMTLLLYLFPFIMPGCTPQTNSKTSTANESNQAGQDKKNPIVYAKETNSGISTQYKITHQGDSVTKVVRQYEAAIPDSMFEKHSLADLKQLYTDQYINPEHTSKGINHEILVNEQEKKLTVVSTVNTNEAEGEPLPNVFELTAMENIAQVEEKLKEIGFTQQ